MAVEMGPSSGLKYAKPEPRKRTTERKKRVKHMTHGEVHDYVFGRERYICRCCRKRNAESMHEVQGRGRGGRVSPVNSIAVCGQLVGVGESCHTFLQRGEIAVSGTAVGAEGTIEFEPRIQKAADWMGIPLGDSLESPVMQHTEIAS